MYETIRGLSVPRLAACDMSARWKRAAHCMPFAVARSNLRNR